MTGRDDSLRDQGWEWKLTAYYADNVKPPKTPGALAIETVHKGLSSRDIEMAAFRSRPDIGRVDVVQL